MQHIIRRDKMLDSDHMRRVYIYNTFVYRIMYLERNSGCKEQGLP